MWRSRMSCLAIAISLISTLPALAAEGAIPIFEPTVITAPGRYVVTRNITSDSPIITIASSHVDIDLNGFELSGGTTQPVIVGSLSHYVRIHDGSVVGGNPGIFFELNDQVIIENTVVIGSAGVGIHLNESINYVVRRCLLSAGSKALQATAAFGSQGTIDDNQITGCGMSVAITECLLVQGGYGVTIRDNKFVGHINGNGIKLISSPTSSVSGNQFYDLGGDTLNDAIVIESSTAVSVKANTADEPIRLASSTHAVVANNRILSIYLDLNSHSNTILRNTALGGYPGVQVEGDRNRVEANVLNDSGYGLHFTSTAENNVYAGNVARGGTSSSCTGTGTTDFCDEGTGNTSNGDNYIPNKM